MYAKLHQCMSNTKYVECSHNYNKIDGLLCVQVSYFEPMQYWKQHGTETLQIENVILQKHNGFSEGSQNKRIIKLVTTVLPMEYKGYYTPMLTWTIGYK